MLPTPEGVQRIHTLLGQAVWHTQILELALSRYIVLRNLERRQDLGEIVSESDYLKSLSTAKSQPLKTSYDALKELNLVSSESEATLKMFLTEKDWVFQQCVTDNLISFRNPKTKKYFYGLIESYIGEARNRKLGVLQDIEDWFERKGYDLEQASQVMGDLPKEY